MADQASQEPTAGSSSTPAPSTPSPKTSGDPLLQSIKSFVNVSNTALASFEEVTDETSHMLVSRLQQLGKQGRYIVTRAMSTYEHRGQYGPQVVAGSAAVVGGLVALRTGKVTGTLAGGLAGAGAYGNVYGYEDFSSTSRRNSIPKKD